ncbi:MAG: flavodoxin family protein [bacterium]|nr:flavodoxin family protein [bacterium]
MKITAITGSPRKNGTSARIADSFMNAAKNNSSDTSTYFLNTMNYKGCQGCDACKGKTEGCIQKDDLTAALNDLLDADIAVFSTPVYYGDSTGQFKMFIDRTWSFIKPDYRSSRLAPGKKAVLIITQADVDTVHTDVVDRYTRFLNLYGYEVEIIRAVNCGMDQNADVDIQAAAARDLAEKLTGQERR